MQKYVKYQISLIKLGIHPSGISMDSYIWTK
jgi:hypothetical protein